MIKYLCNDCGFDFKSDEGPDARKCPTCKSEADNHIMMSLTEDSDVLHVKGQKYTCDA